MSNKKWMLYGANGYTGELIAREAQKRGLKPILAGRNQEVISSLAKELGLEFRIFTLESPSIMIEALTQVNLVLHCAGPFSATSGPMVGACLASKTHYLDITGEIEVFEYIRRQHELAVKRRVMLMPGVGFDVVPTDCLALNLKKFLPDATHLKLAFDAEGRSSHGTALTMIEGLKVGVKIRENGVIKSVPFAYKVAEIPFLHGPKLATTIPWGDVSTAYYTTGIPNIEVYKTFSKGEITKMKLLRPLKPLLGTDAIQHYLKSKIANNFRGPDVVDRVNTKCYIWGQVINERGQTKEAHLVTPNGYVVTVHAAVGIVDYLLNYEVEPGVHTPAEIMGEHFVRTLPEVELRVE
jgi:short subunit dehydrogenase-like uncharacterized protein